MNVNKIVVNEIPSEIEFSGATLLSADEASTLLTEQEKKYKAPWWLRTPGFNSYNACNIYYGSVDIFGSNVDYYCCIRPALQISNLGSFNVGDIFSIGEHYFKIISPELAWLYKQDIGEDHFDYESNNYETSHVKEIVDSWFEKLKDETI